MNVTHITSQSVSDMTGLPEVCEWHLLANRTLHEAMINERSKRWKKVVANYRTLIHLVNRVKPKIDLERPHWMTMLLYECFYHLGVALQQLGLHRKAIIEYTNAIQTVYIPRGSCVVAKCHSNSCLMTPLYTRRAFAYSLAGNLKEALKDAEHAVVLDKTNPDVYCIRALVNKTKNETTLARDDVSKALQLNSSHLCGLILHGQLAERSKVDSNLSRPGYQLNTSDICMHHVKACSINPDCHNYLTVCDFKHDDIILFYERFLFSLGVPHTVSEIPLPASPRWDPVPRRGHTVSGSRGPRLVGTSGDWDRRTGSSSRSITTSRAATPTLSTSSDWSDLNIRRLDHFILQPIKTSTSQDFRTSNSAAHEIEFLPEPRRNKSPANNIVSCEENELKKTDCQKTMSGNAPRLYYRPWIGDKLPVAEFERKSTTTTPFRI